MFVMQWNTILISMFIFNELCRMFGSGRSFGLNNQAFIGLDNKTFIGFNNQTSIGFNNHTSIGLNNHTSIGLNNQTSIGLNNQSSIIGKPISFNPDGEALEKNKQKASSLVTIIGNLFPFFTFTFWLHF